MKRIGRFLLFALIVILLAGGGYWLYRTRVAKAQTTAAGSYTQVVDVKQGSLRASITVVGELDAVQSADLTFSRMSGSTKLLSLTVQTGNKVKAGQVLATIDPAPYQQARDQAKSDLDAAEEQLADLKTPATSQELVEADLAIAKAGNQVEQAKKSLADLKAPDFASLQQAIQNAKDSLALAQLQQTLAEHDSLAKSERDLQYAVNWHQRKIAELQALVQQGKANLEQTQQLTTEQETLSQVQADLSRVSAQRELSLRSAAASVTQAQAVLATAVDALATAQAGGDALALAKAQLAVKEAEVALAAAQDARAKLVAGSDATTVAAAQADLDKKHLALADAEAALADASLVAPFDGTVLKVNTAAGNSVTASTKILTLADLAQLQVVASVNETAIRQVKVGQAATITFDALVGKTFRGQVISVPLQGALQGNVMVYDVPISLTGAENQPLLVGMTANVVLSLGQVENALLVPAMAVQRASGQNQVLLVNAADAAATPQAVPVEVGLSDGVNTQIVKGLNLGDKVLVQMTSSSSGNNLGFDFGGPGVGFEAGPQGAPPAGIQGGR